MGAGKKTAKRRETPIVLADVILPVLSDLCDHTPGEQLIRINKDNCRHTAATTLALANIPPSVIQQIMRHTKFSTTEQYIHVSIDPMLEAVNKLSLHKKEA